MSKIGILGAGSWGMALTKMLADTGHEPTVWTFHSEKLDDYKKNRKYPKLDCVLPENIFYEKDLEKACRDKDIVMMAVPSVNGRSIMHLATPFLPDGQIIVNVSQGD